jgi:dTDP-4-dehydrorhamnose 3,5-epimerase
MIFKALEIPGCYLIELDRKNDDRGFFARSFCQKEFAQAGLVTEFVQNNISYNARKGTLRGMHWQKAPHPEVKVVRCTRGHIFDVALDLRSDSPTFLQWFGVELSAENGKALYLPAGVAHGFQTLEDGCEVHYQMSDEYYAELARGVRFDDPAFSIRWPLPVTIVSDKDLAYPTWTGSADL